MTPLQKQLKAAVEFDFPFPETDWAKGGAAEHIRLTPYLDLFIELVGAVQDGDQYNKSMVITKIKTKLEEK